jgi:uncharacterized NAD(P)/FAD-binding protein YdhS
MDGTAPPPRTLAIIGGGFSGACLALHLARANFPGRIVIFEPRPVLGRGVAYSTRDDAHRINARAARMSLYPDDPTHFTRWLAETGACDDDAASVLPDGRQFPRRAVYGAYVTAQVAPLLAAGRVAHVRDEVSDLLARNGGWQLRGADGALYEADIVVLATGHAPPGIPAPLAGVADHPAFVANPLRPGALDGVAPDAKILIIGTGLTMADTVASLDRAGHTGAITAISRRGQSPRPHAMEDQHGVADFAPPASACALLRQVRAAVKKAEAEGLTWQGVLDSLRWRAEELWRALPVPERRRLLRHARPFWDTHRHRLPPPTAAILARRLAENTLRIAAAAVAGVHAQDHQIEVFLRPRGAGAAAREIYDAVILTAGPGRLDQPEDALSAKLLTSGLLTLDATGQGFCCGIAGQVEGRQSPPLFVIGPPTRGTFAEIISVPEIARQIDALTAAAFAEAPDR